MDFHQRSPTTSASMLLAGNSNRTGLTIYNVGEVTVYIHKYSGVTAANGFPIPADSFLEVEGLTEDLYGITASGTGDLRIAEAP